MIISSINFKQQVESTRKLDIFILEQSKKNAFSFPLIEINTLPKFNCIYRLFHASPVWHPVVVMVTSFSSPTATLLSTTDGNFRRDERAAVAAMRRTKKF